MRATYSILAPYAQEYARHHRRPAAFVSGPNWITARRTSSASWLFAMGCLVIGVPAALATSVYLLSGPQSPALESSMDGDMENVALALPSLPAGSDASLAAAPQQLAVTEVPADADDEADTVTAATVPGVKPAVPADPSRRVLTLAWGETLMGLLLKSAVPEADAHEALASLRGVYDPRDIQAGEEVVVRYNETGAFAGFEFEPTADRTVRVARQNGDFKAASIVRPLSNNVMAARVEIEGSLYESGIRAGVPASTMSALVKALSFSVDFQRDIKAGDSFKVMYQVIRNPEGTLVRTGEILYAEVKLSDRTVPVYRYRFADGRVEYFDRSGSSVRKALMRTPVNAARITSGFGMREHPLFGYTRMHKGVDFGAPTGTPIYAAGDGVIIDRGWKNGYGNFIQIRHNGQISTAYGHMSRFSNGFTRGSRVRQGQVIGFVGSTGNSTGPHLHFEVRVNNQPVNPMTVANLRAGEKLAGANLQRLKNIAASIDEQFGRLPEGLAQDVAFNATTGEAIRPAVQVQAKRLED